MRYHRENCTSMVRKVSINKFGDICSLIGTHAFEWSIITDVKGIITTTTYKNRVDATKEFNKIVKSWQTF